MSLLKGLVKKIKLKQVPSIDLPKAPELEIQEAHLLPLSVLPTTKSELRATAKIHRERLDRVQRINKLIDDYADGDGVLSKRRLV